MEIKILHLSDIHFAPGGHEQKPAFKPFLLDLEAEIKGTVPTYLVLSGDVAFAGAQSEHYTSLLERLGPALDNVGIPKHRRIVVPGNHDVSSQLVEQRLLEHEPVVAAGFDENTYNNFVESPPELFKAKFKNFLDFQREFAGYGISEERLAGAGHTLPEEVGIFCLNTAIFSSGAAKQNGVRINDKGRLGLPTRVIAEWLDREKSSVKILVGHHPSTWLNEWSRIELRKLSRQFGLILTGHEHEQDVFHHVEFGGSLVQLAAPALLTSKLAPMGYAIVNVCTHRGPSTVKYRQWSNKSKFVSGTLMSETDSGILELLKTPMEVQSDQRGGYVFRFHDSGLEKALRAFGRHSGSWVEPVIKRVSETDRNRGAAAAISLPEIVLSKASIFIKAPPQYGLSCLGWMLGRQAAQEESVWLRVDLAITKPHKVRDELRAQLKTFGADASQIGCIIVDSWTSSMHNSVKCLDAIVKEYPTVRLVVLETEDRPVVHAAFNTVADRTFEQYYLWALPRSGLRQVVRDYYDESAENAVRTEQVLVKIVGDLAVLNLPRTALNCLTLLMVSELEYDDSPINRAEVIKRILYLIFSSEVSLTYRSRADVKDCEHLLGYFAEIIVREGESSFTREKFLSMGSKFCGEMLVDLDVKGVLAILIESGVIVDEGGVFRFRFSYWVYYFAALRMHHDAGFAKYVLTDMQYTRFPEVMEFYTGFDRRREDAVDRLEADLTALATNVEKKCGLATPAELYAGARWNPSDDDIERMRADIEERVSGSSLPVEIKDQFADRTYDASKPYNQVVKDVMEAYSYDNLTAGVSAASRALRNSDYVSPEKKKLLLAAIMRCWEQIQTVVVLITPSLAHTGRASFDGTNFVMVDLEESDLGDQAVGKIWSAIPFNVLAWFRSDIASAKMGPLLYSMLRAASPGLTKHNIATLIISIRPKGWRLVIEEYIAGVDKNSFFLMDTFGALDTEYKYELLTEKARSDVGDLVKMSLAKHEKGIKRPGIKLIGKYTIKSDSGESF